MIDRSTIEEHVKMFLTDLFSCQDGRHLSALQEDAIHKSLVNSLDGIINDDQYYDDLIKDHVRDTMQKKETQVNTACSVKNVCHDYPDWICTFCAKENGGKWPDGHIGTFHNGVCGWCGEEVQVTEPRDWGYPNFKKVRFL